MRVSDVALIVMVAFAVLTLIVNAQTPAPPPDQQMQILIARLAASQEKLGVCNADLGPLQQLEAKVLRGEVASVEAVVQAIQRANPTLVIDQKTLKVSEKPKDAKGGG